MITKERFVEIINQLQELSEITDRVNALYRNCSNEIVRDFVSGAELLTLDSIIVELLEDIFDDKECAWIAYYAWELGYGKDYRKGGVTYMNEDVPLGTAEELYDLLRKE